MLTFTDDKVKGQIARQLNHPLAKEELRRKARSRSSAKLNYRETGSSSAVRRTAAGVAGTSTSHGAQDNLYKINRVLEGDPNQTFGMDELLRGTDFEEAYAAVGYYTGYPRTKRRLRDVDA